MFSGYLLEMVAFNTRLFILYNKHFSFGVCNLRWRNKMVSSREKLHSFDKSDKSVVLLKGYGTDYLDFHKFISSCRWEAVILLVLYVLYIFVMLINPKLEKWIDKNCRCCGHTKADDEERIPVSSGEKTPNGGTFSEDESSDNPAEGM